MLSLLRHCLESNIVEMSWVKLHLHFQETQALSSVPDPPTLQSPCCVVDVLAGPGHPTISSFLILVSYSFLYWSFSVVKRSFFDERCSSQLSIFIKEASLHNRKVQIHGLLEGKIREAGFLFPVAILIYFLNTGSFLIWCAALEYTYR